MGPLKTDLFQYRYLPARIGQSREKVLIVLHGLGDSLNGFTWMPSELGVDAFSYLLVNAPDPYFGGFSWYDFLEDPEPGILRSRRLLLQLIEELVQQGIDSRDLYFFGFSQGCLMTADVGLRCQRVLGGLCGVSGYVGLFEEYPEAFAPAAQEQRFLFTHGLRDPVVPYGPAKDQFLKLKGQGIDLEFHSYDKDHTVLPEELKDIADWFRGRLKDNP